MSLKRRTGTSASKPWSSVTMATHSLALRRRRDRRAGWAATARRKTSILGRGAALEAFDQDDVGAGEVLAARGRSDRSRPGSRSKSARMSGLARSTRSAGPRGSAARCRMPGLVHLGGVVAVLDGHDPVAPAHELARQGDGQGRLSGVLPADDGDDSCRRHSSSALREVVRGVHVEEQELRVRRSGATSDQGEDTDPDALMEADGPEVALVEALRRWRRGRRARRRRRAARRRAGRRSAAGRRRARPRPSARRRISRLGDERHVPGDADDRGRRLDHRGVDPTQRAEARPHVGHHAQIRPPARRLGRVGDEQRRLAQGRRHHPHQPVEDPLAADRLEPLRACRRTGWRHRRRGSRPARRRSVAPPPVPLEDHVDADQHAEQCLKLARGAVEPRRGGSGR